MARPTQKRELADELRRQREEQQIILDAMPAMVWYKDRDNRILRANRAAAEAINRTTAELTGVSTWELYPDEAAAYHRDDLEVMDTLRVAERPEPGGGPAVRYELFPEISIGDAPLLN